MVFTSNSGGPLMNTLYLASSTILITLVSKSLIYTKGIQLKGLTVCSKTCKSCYWRQKPLLWGSRIC